MISPKAYLFLALLLPYLAYTQEDDDDDEGGDDDGPVPTTAVFTDPLSNITFQRFFGARTQFAFGIALPQNPTTDFIGQMTFPTTGAGWGGISLTDDMVGPLLLAAWPNGNSVVSSFRRAQTEDDSPPVFNGNFQITEIPSGTAINGTHVQFTWLCKGCIGANLGLAAQDTTGNFEMGWAFGSASPNTIGDPASELPFHDTGFDSFVAQLALARSAEFDTWAALATGGQSPPAGNITSTPLPAAGASAAPAPAKNPATSTGKENDDDDDDDD